jgi:two-component system, response regulator PdtaR
MLTNKAQYSVLIVTGTEKGTLFISEMLDPMLYNPIKSVKSAGEARRLLITETFDVVVVNAPLSDEFGYELALTVAEKAEVGIILIVKNEVFD